MKIQWLAWILVAGFAGAASTRGADIFRAGFETTDTPSYEVGQQLHQAGDGTTWSWNGDNIGVISTNEVARYAGDQGLDATRSTFSGSQIWWTRPGGPFTALSNGVVEFHLTVKTTDWADSGDSLLEIAGSDTVVSDVGANSTRSFWLTLEGNGNLRAMNGENNIVVASGLDVSAWNSIKVIVDLDARRYRVFVNESLVANDYSYFAAGVTNITSLQFKEYNSERAYGGVYLDEVVISPRDYIAGDIFSAGFETTDTPPYVVGEQIHLAGGEPYRWGWAGDDIGEVVNDPVAVFSGSQGLAVVRSADNSQFWWTRGTNAFAPVTSGVVSVSFALKTEGWSSNGDSFLEFWVQTAALDANDDGANKAGRSAYVSLHGDGLLKAYTNNSFAITLANELDVSGWLEVRVEIDLSAGLYNVFLNAAQVATNFTFFGSSAANVIRSIQFKEYNNGLLSGSIYLDEVKISSAEEPEMAAIAGVQSSGNLAIISVGSTSAGRIYRVWGLGDLMVEPQAWTDTGVALPGNDSTLSLTVTNTSSRYFYRVQAE